MTNTCGYCLFRKETGSTDILWCWKKREHHDVMDPGCEWFKKESKFSIFEEEG